MSYIKPKYNKTTLKSVDTYEGEPIEHKIERILSNEEPITDGAEELYTDRKDGVKAEYNIRTDRFELAAESMDLVSKNKAAKRDANARAKEEKKSGKVIKMDKDGKTESKSGTSD
jgi:hypothetical protein